MPILDKLEEQPVEDLSNVDLTRPVQQTSNRGHNENEPLPKFGQADCFKLIFTGIVICFCCAVGFLIILAVILISSLPSGNFFYYLQSCQVNILNNIDTCTSRTCDQSLSIDSRAFNISGLDYQDFQGTLNRGGFNFTVSKQRFSGNIFIVYDAIYNSTTGMNIRPQSPRIIGPGQIGVYYEFRIGAPGPTDPKGVLVDYNYFKLCGIK